MSLTTGSTNSAFGGRALGTADTGARNSAFGNNALTNVDGDSNTAVGDSALGPLTSGDHNTAIGTDAGEGLASGDNNIYVAGTPAPSGATESNTTRIGVPSQTRAFIAGIRGVTTGLNDAIPVLIDSAGQLGTVSSSRRYKQDIRAMGRASDPIMQLRPVTFRYRSDPSGLRYGLIAEQVAKAMPTLAVSGNDGRPETVKYQDLPVLLLNEVQRQRRQLRRQQAQIVRLMHLVRGR